MTPSGHLILSQNLQAKIFFHYSRTTVDNLFSVQFHLDILNIFIFFIPNELLPFLFPAVHRKFYSFQTLKSTSFNGFRYRRSFILFSISQLFRILFPSKLYLNFWAFSWCLFYAHSSFWSLLFWICFYHVWCWFWIFSHSSHPLRLSSRWSRMLSLPSLPI